MRRNFDRKLHSMVARVYSVYKKAPEAGALSVLAKWAFKVDVLCSSLGRDEARPRSENSFFQIMDKIYVEFAYIEAFDILAV